MINKIKNLYYSVRYSNFVSRLLYSRPLRAKIISSIIFVVLFFLICAAFEWLYPRSVSNQINSLIHNILWFGVK
jgi:hypothetical protein